MQNLGTFLLDFLAQFGGGRGELQNELVRTSLAALFWATLLAFTLWRRDKAPVRERILVWGFGLGLAREAFLFFVFALEITGLFAFRKSHLIFPPLEHALLTGSVLTVAGAFIRYLLDDPNITRRYLVTSALVTGLGYIVIAPAWALHLKADPASRFGLHWGDMYFHAATLLMLACAVVLFLNRKGILRSLILLPMSFFALDDLLMVFNLAMGDVQGPMLGPIRHNLHIWAIPLLGLVYIWETKEESDRTNIALEESLAEKEILLKEIHHRVKNNLQSICGILELHRILIHNDEGAKVYRDCQNRVFSMALIHERLHQEDGLASVPMGHYVQGLVDYLRQSFGGRREVRFRVECGSIALNPDTAIPCGLLVNELVSNALKHAFPDGKGGTITIHLRVVDRGEGFELRVKDDGVGLPPGWSIDQERTLGIRLVRSLVEQLGGTLTVESLQGAAFHITFRSYQEAGTAL